MLVLQKIIINTQMYNAEQKQYTNNTVNMYCTASSDTFIGDHFI